VGKITRRTAGWCQMPQVLPVLQEEPPPELKESVPPPLSLEAKVESFFFTCGLPQAGQVTSSTWLGLRSSSSKGCSHFVHTNSNKGMSASWNDMSRS
jgi:hypothetical protein